MSPSKDNTLYESADGSVSNGAGEHLFAGKTNSGSIRRALLAFDIAGSVPAGATITDVVLELNMSKSQAGATAVELRRVLADWGEGASDASGNEGPGTAAAPGDATWLHRSLSAAMWQTPGGDFSSNASASGQVADVGTYAWGSTAQLVAAVQSWLDDPSTNFGWVVVGNEAVNQTTKRFSSRETPDEANRPRLTVTFISK